MFTTIHEVPISMFPNEQQKELIERAFYVYDVSYNYCLDIATKDLAITKTVVCDTAKWLANMNQFFNDNNPLYPNIMAPDFLDPIVIYSALTQLSYDLQAYSKKELPYPTLKHDFMNEYRSCYIGLSYKMELTSAMQNASIYVPVIGQVPLIMSNYLPQEDQIKPQNKLLGVKFARSKTQYTLILIIESEVVTVYNMVKNNIGIYLDKSDYKNITLSNGEIISIPPYIQENLYQIKALQSQLDSEPDKDNVQIRGRLQKTINQVQKQIPSWYNSVASQLVDNYKYIFVENQAREFGWLDQDKNIILQGWLQFISAIHSKINELRKDVILMKLNKDPNRLRKCSICGYLLPNFAISDWQCPICNTKHGLKVNAAINILQDGRLLLFRKQKK